MLIKTLILIFPILILFCTTTYADEVSLMESDFQASFQYGPSLISGSSPRYLNFAADLGYHAYPKDIFSHLTVDIYGGYFTATVAETLVVGYGGVRYYFSEANQGFNVGVFAGYGSRPSVRGLAMAGVAGYDYRLADQWSLGIEGGAHYMSANKITLITTFVNLKYWF